MIRQWRFVMSKSPLRAHASDQQVVLQLDQINKIFNADTPLKNHVLHDISLQVSRGELVLWWALPVLVKYLAQCHGLVGCCFSR